MPDDLENRVTRVEMTTDGIQSSITKMDTKLDLIVAQVSKIAVLELNHQQHKETFARAFKRIEDLETKSSTLTTIMDKATGGTGMLKYLVGAFGGSLIGLVVWAISKVGA